MLIFLPGQAEKINIPAVYKNFTAIYKKGLAMRMK